MLIQTFDSPERSLSSLLYAYKIILNVSSNDKNKFIFLFNNCPIEIHAVIIWDECLSITPSLIWWIRYRTIINRNFHRRQHSSICQAPRSALSVNQESFEEVWAKPNPGDFLQIPGAGFDFTECPGNRLKHWDTPYITAFRDKRL